MNAALAIATLTLGVAYVLLGGVALVEVLGGYRTRGLTRFGVGLVMMGWVCGPHHILHGVLALRGDDGEWLVMVATVVGLPAVIVLLGLRAEVMAGGRGDRFIAGTPRWISLAPVGFLIVAGVLLDRSLQQASSGVTYAGGDVVQGMSWVVFLPNLVMAVTYAIVGWWLLRTQVRRRDEHGGWSLSGLAMGAVFPTSSLMHLVVAFHGPPDPVLVWLDLWGVPVSVYFLWVVNGLHRRALVDWNRRPLAGEAGRPDRSSPWDQPSTVG